nr:ribonuclease H-like domain-containing protein [Tanacetum cinerariifolium]
MHGEVIPQEEINQKYLRSLSQAWTMHTIMWRNKPEITMSLDYLYNNLKSYESEGAIDCSTTVENLSDVVIYSFFASQPRNRSYLADYEEIDGGFVAIREFKLTDESHVLLKVPRKNNMYSVDLKNIVSKGGLTCLLGKATSDESNLWHKRLRHDFPGAGFKPSGEEEKKDVEDLWNEDSEVPRIEEPRVNQEKDANVNSTNNINTVSPTDNAAGIEDNDVDENVVYRCVDDPNMPDLEEIGRFIDIENDDSGADINNLDT